MNDLTKLEKPYVLCTPEEQEGLKALVGIQGALQNLNCGTGEWEIRLVRHASFNKCWVYRQNPDWQQPKLDVPDWFWKNTIFNWVVMDQNGYFYLCDMEPCKGEDSWYPNHGVTMVRLDYPFNQHNFNPHNIPWHQSLTKRPEGK